MTFAKALQNFRNFAYSNDTHEQYSALLFALQIPSILSRIEFPLSTDNTESPNNSGPDALYWPNGKCKDKELYKKWLRTHSHSFKELLVKDVPNWEQSIYSIRNSMTHNGVFPTEKRTFVFIPEKDCGLCLPGIVFICISDFCDAMFTEAEICLRQLGIEDYPLICHLTHSDFSSIRQGLCNLYDNFWEGRQEALSLYQRYGYRFEELSLDEHEQFINENKLSNEEYQLLIETINELANLQQVQNEILLAYDIILS